MADRGKQSGLTFKVSAAAVFHPLQMLLWWQMLAVAPGGVNITEFAEVKGHRAQTCGRIRATKELQNHVKVQCFYRPIICWLLGLI